MLADPKVDVMRHLATFCSFSDMASIVETCKDMAMSGLMDDIMVRMMIRAACPAIYPIISSPDLDSSGKALLERCVSYCHAANETCPLKVTLDLGKG